MMDVLTSETCWVVNNEIITQVGLSLFNYVDRQCTYNVTLRRAHLSIGAMEKL